MPEMPGLILPTPLPDFGSWCWASPTTPVNELGAVVPDMTEWVSSLPREGGQPHSALNGLEVS